MAALLPRAVNSNEDLSSRRPGDSRGEGGRGGSQERIKKGDKANVTP